MRVSRWWVLLALSVAGLVGCATQDMELSNEGFRAISAKNYGQAETSLKKALSINPRNSVLASFLGEEYFQYLQSGFLSSIENL